MSDQSVKHPYYDTSLADARRLGARLCAPLHCLDNPPPVEDQKALDAIQAMRNSVGHNWIAGRVAAELLQTAITGKPCYST